MPKYKSISLVFFFLATLHFIPVSCELLVSVKCKVEGWIKKDEDCEGRQDGKDKAGQCHHKDLGNGKAASQNGVGRNPSPHKRSDIIALSIPIPTIALFNQNKLVIFI